MGRAYRMKKVFKPFIKTNIEKSERWLSEMAKNGWRLEKVDFDNYYFKESAPKNLKYTILVMPLKKIDLRVFDLAYKMTKEWRAIKIPVSRSECSGIYSYEDSIDDRALKCERNKLLIGYRKGFFIMESAFILLGILMLILLPDDRIEMLASIPIFIIIIAMWVNDFIAILRLYKSIKQ